MWGLKNAMKFYSAVNGFQVYDRENNVLMNEKFSLWIGI